MADIPILPYSLIVGQDDLKLALRLRDYNDYREACEFPRAKTFEDISSDPRTCDALREVCNDVDEVEFFVGLFAEDTRPNSILPPLIGRLVGLHLFSQLLTNRCSRRKSTTRTRSPGAACRSSNETRSLADIVRRNIAQRTRMPLVTLTRADCKRV